MKTSDDLFFLIKSLTISEKRHFKLFSSSYSGEKKYLKIFDAIDRQKEYDEKAIIKIFPKEKFIRNFSVAKAYLYVSILKSIELFNSDRTDTLQIRTLINRAELLGSKNLTSQALKLLKRAKKIAEENDSFPYQLEISQMEQKLMCRKPELDWLKKNKKNIINYENKVVEKFKNLQQYRSVECDFVIRANSVGVARTKEDLKKMKALRIIDLLKDERSALSNTALVYHYHLNGGYYYLIKNFQKSLQNCILEKNFIGHSQTLKKKHLSSYIIAINNILSTGIDTLGFEELIQTAENLREIKNMTPQHEKRIMIRYYSNVLSICKKHVRIPEALIYAKETEEWLLKQEGEIEVDQIKVVYYNLADIHFLNTGYKESLKWLNEFSKLPKDIRSGMYTTAQILNMVLQYELGNQDLLEYTIRSCYRHLYKHNKLYKYETLILDFIRNKVTKINNKREIMESFKTLKTQLEMISRDPYEKKAFSHFDFISWLESKIENRPFAEVMKEKVKLIRNSHKAIANNVPGHY